MNAAAARIVAELALAPLPQEGGFFRVQWISGARDAGGRPRAGLIWFLLTPEGFSAWHRVDAAERWEVHAGDTVEHVQLDPATGTPHVILLGGDDEERPRRSAERSLVVPAHTWQGARLAPAAAKTIARGWALVSCTMTPAWEERGFALGERAALLREFPAAADWIRGLTR